MNVMNVFGHILKVFSRSRSWWKRFVVMKYAGKEQGEGVSVFNGEYIVVRQQLLHDFRLIYFRVKFPIYMFILARNQASYYFNKHLL